RCSISRRTCTARSPGRGSANDSRVRSERSTRSRGRPPRRRPTPSLRSTADTRICTTRQRRRVATPACRRLRRAVRSVRRRLGPLPRAASFVTRVREFSGPAAHPDGATCDVRRTRMELPKLDLGSLRSPFAEQLRSGFGGLCCSGRLEQEFRELHTAQSLPRARWSALISLVVVLSIAAFESLAGPTVGLPPGGTVRLFVLCPALALVALAMSVPALRPLYTWIAGGGATVIGLISIYLSQSAALQGAPHVLAGLVIAVLLACLFFGLLFPVAVAVSAVLIAANVLVGLALQLPVNQLSYITAMMTAAAVIGSIWTYKLEHALRTNFLETRLLN